MFVKFSDFKHFGVARKFLLYNKLAIFKVGETVTLKMANSL